MLAVASAYRIVYKSEVSGEKPVKDLAKVLNYAARYI
jgi:hypothetical protein